jgi:hypothetical protein
MEMVLAGQPSKIIGTNLGIGLRTVENHGGSIMKKTASRSLPVPARLALAASWTETGAPFAGDELTEASGRHPVNAAPAASEICQLTASVPILSAIGRRLSVLRDDEVA